MHKAVIVEKWRGGTPATALNGFMKIIPELGVNKHFLATRYLWGNGRFSTQHA
jgi:hypothetical protein